MKNIIEIAELRADEKQKVGKKSNHAFFANLLKLLVADVAYDQAIRAALIVASRSSTDSLSWLLQGIASDLFWSLRSHKPRVARQAFAVDEETVEALKLLADGSDNNAAWYAGEEDEAVSYEVLVEEFDILMSTLSDWYLMAEGSTFDQLPIITVGPRAAFDLDTAEYLAEEIMAEGRAKQKSADRNLLLSKFDAPLKAVK